MAIKALDLVIVVCEERNTVAQGAEERERNIKGDLSACSDFRLPVRD
jgi:hypothetical protein